MDENNKKTAIQAKHIIIAVLVVIALFIMYRFALNGRYVKMDRSIVFDKWTEKVIDTDVVWDDQYSDKR